MLLLCIPLSILFILTFSLVFIFLGAPVFFVQERTGLKGKTFNIVKFRSMKIDFDTGGYMMADEKRITKFGHFLRSTSLDEIPTIWNVLKGDMAIVGPRPLLPEYMKLYSQEQLKRHDVRPGITGLAQVNGRNDIEWQERLQLDTDYIKTKNFWLDCKIIIKTIWVVFARKGVSKSGHVSMPKFTENFKNDD